MIIWTEENVAFRSIVEAAECLNVTRQTVSQHVKLNESLADKIHFKKGINDGDMPRLWETLNDDEKQILKKKAVQYMKNEHHKSNKQCLKQIKTLEEKLANIKMIKNYEEQIKMLQLKIENNKVAKRLKAQIEELKKCLQ